jgi:hypothetical protein
MIVGVLSSAQPVGDGGEAVKATAVRGALDVRAALPWLRRLSRTTPGVIVVLSVSIAALSTAAGVVNAAQLDGRIAHQQNLLDRSEPVTFAAQNLYAELSAADAAAAAAFLSGGVQTPSMRMRYQQALAGAASALADATAGAADTQTRTAVAEITEQKATYAGVVEAARANNVQIFPIGSAYLREASSLMQTQILPGAERIYANDLKTVEKDQDAVESTPVAGLALLGLCLAALLVGTVVLAVRTNRQFNIGLVMAAALTLAAIIWLVGVTRVAAADIERGRTEGTERFGQLATARILASEARTEETLELTVHGDPTAMEKDFHSNTDQLAAILTSGPPAAKEGLRKWSESHRQQIEAYRGGDYPRAVAQAIGPGADASAAQYATVEASLRAELDRARATLRDRASAAGTALSWAPTGVLALMIIAAATAVAGMWPRLKEFL